MKGRYVVRGLELRRFVAPEFFFGVDARKLAGRYARNYAARKVLLVTDLGVIAAGWTADVMDSLQEEAIPFVVFSNVSPNPRATEVMEGGEVYRQNNCNVIISVGGGSPTDCAKGIAIVSNNEGNILEFEGFDKIVNPMPPLICVPTTGGTSADVSQFCMITNMDEHIKIIIASKAIVPDTSKDACMVTNPRRPNIRDIEALYEEAT
ncbi:MAG: iron-containing alcohol dehydrogenase [Nitrospirae bacterium]|nr:iron-containing alcohol dehydrogenase [Nitrospirota bacterium]